MKVNQLSKSGDTLNFVLSEATPAFANALRRAAIDDVATMAVEIVEFRKNSSALYDETVAHRLGLIPLKTDSKSYSLPEECKCGAKGCARCEVKLTLSAKGKKSGNVVLSSEIKSTDPSITPAITDIPIVSLYEGQEIEMEMTAILGRGRNHVKWSPGHVFYRQIAEVKPSTSKEATMECERQCPTKFFNVGGKRLVVRKGKKPYCVLCGAPVTAKEGQSLVDTTPGDFVFTVESWGQLPAKEIIIQSIAAIDGKVDSLKGALKGNKKK